MQKGCQPPQLPRFPLKVDVRIDRDVINMVETAVKEFGRLDYAANVAGVSCLAYSSLHRSRYGADGRDACSYR